MFDRVQRALDLRIAVAEMSARRTAAQHVSNGEEEDYPNRIASYSKGLPHNDLGEVDPTAFDALRHALAVGEPELFERIPLGTTGGRRLTNPQAGLAFDLEGADGQALTIRPAPRIDSAENSAEMVELYWQALLRDVPFTRYDSDPRVGEALEDLNDLSDFRGPKEQREVTAGTLFRGLTAGDLTGPYLSQFLLRPIRYGSLTIDQRQETVEAGVDHLVDYDDWLAVQRGAKRAPQRTINGLFIRNLRDLAHYVHVDALYEAYLNACLILLADNTPVDPGNPYVNSRTQDGFGTFGGPHVLSLVTEVATRALKAVWFQKWNVHRRLRPEAFGGRVHNHLTGAASYPINDEVLSSAAVKKVFDLHGTFLLPQAFPEGSPTHPAYGAGHATVAGACVTVLKAWFDESHPVRDPQVVSKDGKSLRKYAGADADQLTVGGELTKLAANIAIGRNGAGVHWRSDYTESVKLGEAIAISVLQEQKATFNEPHFLSLTRFDGTRVQI
ncbi:vanadium-dependent haloperoxidase [Lentzea sp. NPDC051838]|uniref:vanadium-dependent haloperoxidase n=1 Tax=Lentzea sp. NPDC051838 TaxID=3154849 RepID=UPI003423C91A